MKALILGLGLFLQMLPALAWNGAGHRLIASLAWQNLSPATREAIGELLQRHPDAPLWAKKARSRDNEVLFCEAATWADDIRQDARYYDERQDKATPAIPGLFDHARHKHWHFIDRYPDGRVAEGELDTQLLRLGHILERGSDEEKTWALPWLIHLVGDAHQPLHVGRHGDDGGNRTLIANPFHGKSPTMRLHTYWDDLPGPPWLRGERLQERARILAEGDAHDAASPVQDWLAESHALLDLAYPAGDRGAALTVTLEFHLQAKTIAEQRILLAGKRLARYLEAHLRHPVSRETP